jgi:aldehyde:ferredoxin oxidoreductase
MRAAEQIGGEAPNVGVYVKRGHTPRTHDARGRWADILDYATGGVGTSESNGVPVPNPFTASGAVETVVRGKVREFVDSLVVCNMITMTYSGDDVGPVVDMLNAVTGWDFTGEEAIQMSMRVANLFRAFNIRHGMTLDGEEPSPRYGSAPVDGPYKGLSIMDHWKEMLDEYYKAMGWDRKSGKPLPQTLRSLGLEGVIPELWGK